MLNLRYITAVATNHDRGDDCCPNPPFLARTTADDLEESLRDFEKFQESVIEKQLTITLQNDFYLAVWGLVSAYQQHSFELGMRTGTRLMHELLSDAPSLEEVFRRSDAPRLGQKAKKH